MKKKHHFFVAAGNRLHQRHLFSFGRCHRSETKLLLMINFKLIYWAGERCHPWQDWRSCWKQRQQTLQCSRLIFTILTSTTFAFSEICPICCCRLSQHGQHTADAAGEVPLAKQQLENHISIISWIGRYPIIWCHTNIILNMYILLLIFIWNLNPFPNRLSCLKEWLCQTQKLERLPAGRKLSVFLQNDSMIPSTSFSACQCLFPDPVRAQYRV